MAIAKASKRVAEIERHAMSEFIEDTYECGIALGLAPRSRAYGRQGQPEGFLCAGKERRMLPS